MDKDRIDSLDKLLKTFLITGICYIVVEAFRNFELDKDTVLIYLIAIAASIIIYSLNMNYNVMRNKDIDIQLFKKRKMSLYQKVMIIVLAYIAKDCLSVFVYFGQSPHQKELKTAYNDHNFFELVLSHSFVPAVIEEIMNRAFIFIGVYIIVLMINNIRNKDNNLSKLYNRHGLIFLTISSLWFGYLHIDGLSEIKYMWIHVASGFIFGLVYLYTKDIKMPIILHGLSNLLAVMSDYNAITSNVHSIIMLVMGCLFICTIIFIIYDILRNEKEGYVYKNCYLPLYIYVSDNKEKSSILMFLFKRMKV